MSRANQTSKLYFSGGGINRSLWEQEGEAILQLKNFDKNAFPLVP
jgi:hypothetical protein